jgi:vacuolar protein sorting-associated protein 13A/C
MFSYDSDERTNRALIKVDTSAWSAAQSFDAVGQASQTVIEKEYDDEPGDVRLGININRGLGQYKLSTIVTIRPRFVVESFLDEAIYFRQPGATTSTVLEPRAKKDVLFLSSESPQLCLRFGDGARHKWCDYT